MTAISEKKAERRSQGIAEKAEWSVITPKVRQNPEKKREKGDPHPIGCEREGRT